MCNISRRDALKLLGLAGASAVIPPTVRPARAVQPPVPSVNVLKSKPFRDREVVEADLVVVGTGLGGLWAAVTAADQGMQRIAVVDKGGLGVSSGSSMILAGTLYWLDGDDLDACEKEYLTHNGGLGHIDMLRDMMQTSQRRMNKWRQWGVEYAGLPLFDRIASDGNEHNKLSLNPRYKEWSNGRALIQCLLDRMDAQGVAVYYSKPMVTDLPASTMDIMPTIVDLLDLPDDSMLDLVDGTSLASILDGRIPDLNRTIPFTSNGTALIEGNYKLFQEGRGRNARWVLYDLKEDPKETSDISKENPERFEQMIKGCF